MKKSQDIQKYYLQKRTERHLIRLREKKEREARRNKSLSGKTDENVTLRRELKYLRRIITGGMERKKVNRRSHLTRVRLNVELPECFSIIENPQACLESFKAFQPLFENSRINNVIVHHGNTKNHDLAAEILLAKIAKAGWDLHKTKRRTFSIYGDYPKSESLSRLIKSIGIVKELDVEGHAMESNSEEIQKIIIFKRQNWIGQELPIGSLDYKTKATQDFVAHINKCLEQSGHELTDIAKQHLAEYVGEIITNAQDHSGTDHWQIHGYLDKDNEERICEVVIFNFGYSYADTFNNLQHDDFARTELNKYLRQHESQGIFKKGWSEECLTTLFCLQGSISSKNHPDDTTRGHGTVSLIEFFHSISNVSSTVVRKAKMCILSGSEHIQFDGTYHLQENDGRPIIAFNDENDLQRPPDRNYVKSLNNVAFPGTLISIQFILPETATVEISQ